MTLPAWQEEPIAKKHDRAGFDCGQGALNIFLRQHARQSHWYVLHGSVPLNDAPLSLLLPYNLLQEALKRAGKPLS